MCGICGIINIDGRPVDRAVLEAMNRTMAHRGPDGEGYYINQRSEAGGQPVLRSSIATEGGRSESGEAGKAEARKSGSRGRRGNVGLGHRRLSIIDLAAGKQPLCNEDGTVWITFNGEIYNFLELKKELEGKGHRFQTKSDTETIVHAYEEWGEDAVKKLSGMFAFAIWDNTNQELFLARDRVGKKPLYWYWNGNTFAFASEIKALLAANLSRFEIDPTALDSYFCFGYVPSPSTIFKNVHKLEPGHTLTLTKKGVEISSYWSLSFASPSLISFEDAVDEFEILLDNATKCRLMSEVPLGAFLSGGIDSTLVVSSMVKTSQRSVLTNSIGFNEKKYSELPVAKAAAEHLKTNHHEFTVAPNALDVINKIAWHFDEPFADSSAVPTWYVCQMARKNVTVALSGDGGDEGFGGYTFRYIPHLLESRIRSYFPAWFRKAVFGTTGALYPASAKLPRYLRWKTYLENLSLTDGEAYINDLAWLRFDERKKLYSEQFVRDLSGFDPRDLPLSKYLNSDARDALGKSQHTDIRFYMTDDVLVKVDRMSMAHSLEVRSPLLDYRILEFAARLPESLKIQARQGKVLLRHLAKKRLPKTVLDQPKRGFSIPAAEWLRTDLRATIEEKVLKREGLIPEYLSRSELSRMWQDHKSGKRDHNVFFWGLLMLSLWAEHYCS